MYSNCSKQLSNHCMLSILFEYQASNVCHAAYSTLDYALFSKCHNGLGCCLYFLLLKMINSLTNQEPNYYMPAKCDSMAQAFWKWLAAFGGVGPEWLGIPMDKSLGKPYSWIWPMSVPLWGGQDALLDHYWQHSDVWSSCCGAHKTLHALHECMAVAGILLLATSSALTGISATPQRVPAVVGAGMLLLPQLLLRPLIRRLECAPWPRKEWLQPSPLRELSNTRSP
jgi:hypothetical protein